MKTLKFNTEEEWLEARRGRITGTRAGGLLSVRDKKPLKGFYELIAERIAIPASNENVMDRGKRLEEVAIEAFMAETGKKVDTSLVIWCRDDDENIAISPDGFIGQTEAVEVKCLSSASFIEAYLTKQIPKDYQAQATQYFVVNDKLKKLYFIFFDPRMPIDLFWIEVKRSDIQKEVDKYLELERQVLTQIAELEATLTF